MTETTTQTPETTSQTPTEPTTETPAGTETDRATDPATPATDTPGATDTPAEDAQGSEAARYRRRLRETETERDQLRGQLDAMRSAEVARLAASGDGPRLHDPADLARHGVTTAELLADDGTVDPVKVTAAVERVTDGKAYLRADVRPGPKPDHTQGASGGQGSASRSGWADVLGRGR